MPTEKDNTAALTETRPELLSMSFDELSELLSPPTGPRRYSLSSTEGFPPRK